MLPAPSCSSMMTKQDDDDDDDDDDDALVSEKDCQIAQAQH